MQKQMERESKLYDNDEYFPYTHGDLIEEQRELLNAQMGAELQHHYREALRQKQVESVEKFKKRNQDANKALLSKRRDDVWLKP